MKIWLLAENWPPRIGGIENYLTHIASGLALNHDVTVIAPSGSTAPDTNYRLVTKRFFWPLLKPAWLPLYYWMKKQEQPDLVLCGKALFEGLLARRLGVPYVVFTYAMEIKTWQVGRTRKKLQRVLADAHRVVYINEVTRQHLLELGVAKKQLVKVQPGVDQRFLNTVSAALITSTALHYQVTQPYILAVGRLIPRKGFDILIEAFSKLDQTKWPNHQLAIVGSGPELASLQRLAKEQFMERSIRFLTDVPDKHLPALYAGAEIFALTPRETPEDMEGFGIVYLEAAAAGIPTIATKTGGAQEAVVNNETGIVVPADNPQELQKALTKLLSDEQLRTQLGKAGQERVQKSFTWTVQIQKLLQEISH